MYRDPHLSSTQQPPAGSGHVEHGAASSVPRRKVATPLSHLERLEAESIHIMREVVAECERPVMLYSIGKDSSVMLHLALKAFYPARPPFPFLHVDTTWKFREMIAFRDATAKRIGLDLIVEVNRDGVEAGVNPFEHGPTLYTDVMKTQALKQALDRHRFDAAFGGARRDEEASRAKERIFSIRSAQHRWDPKQQRPELWRVYNSRKRSGETIRVFPLSNWTELDVWQYIYSEQIPIVPLYFAGDRPVVRRAGSWIMVDDERMPLEPARHRQRGAAGASVRAAGTPDRPRSDGLHGEEEGRRILLMHVSESVSDLDAYLRSQERKDLLRFITCGSVDDGKSTLIGRLLYESGMIFEDELSSLAADSRKVGTRGGELDFALLVDGLSAEREQGITIDVAYRFFSTSRRKFVVADTPGHEQYTRNMVTGASTADFAVILVDARKGIVTQTRRHSYLVSLLGIRRVAVAINKMDLVGYSEELASRIEGEYREFAGRMGLSEVTCIPISAVHGDNVVRRSPAMAWYRGPSLLEHL